MVLFWILATSMVAIALSFVLIPLLRSRASDAPSETEANLDVLRGQRQEIDADIDAGVLPADAREEALADLIGRAADDLSPALASTGASERKPWAAAAVAGIAIPGLAFGLYLAIGNPGASDLARLLAEQQPVGDQQIVAMVESLARKVRERPDDAKGWALLARSMAALGRFREAADAYERLASLRPGDADVLADQADALGMVRGQRLDGPPLLLVKKALAIDPKHKKALALAGTAAMDAGDLVAAAGYWQALAAQLPAGSPDAEQVEAVIAEIGQRSLGAQKAASSVPVASAKPLEKIATIQSVTGSVTLAPDMAAKVSGTETVFIFARAERGPRMPLALVRATAGELPMKFALSDMHAMAPGVNLSSAETVRIEARISRSGNAAPQSGDLVGTSEVVKPGASGVSVVVDKVLP
ncbi:MAG: c-type cytochrome biogenesis protein CcmI [Usitatibacter sp.]